MRYINIGRQPIRYGLLLFNRLASSEMLLWACYLAIPYGHNKERLGCLIGTIFLQYNSDCYFLEESSAP
jgi:hypothetical protein